MSRGNPNRLPRIFLVLSRALLTLVAILLVIIPWSERYCALDNFPNGQDVETNVLAFLALVGLMLLVAHLCRQGIAALVSIHHWISRLHFTLAEPAAHALTCFATVPFRAPLPSPPGAFNLPLQI